MRPPPFAYDAPASLAEAVALLAEHGDDAKVIAGGQSLIPLLALRLARPARLVDIGRIGELKHLRANGALVVGATVTQRRAERSPLVGRLCPPLAAALPWVGHVPIRTRGTVGGSVAHADPAAELPAVMLLTDATLVARSTAGERLIAARDFFRGFLETDLRPDELLVEARLPTMRPRAGSAFREVARRHGDFALVGAGAVVQLDETGRIGEARLALCGVAPTPLRPEGAEQLLAGHAPSPEAWAAAADAVRAAVLPVDDLHATAAYRRHVAGVLTIRVLEEAAAGAVRAARLVGEPGA
jgi:carbon-monoxide dehydrogenase medium subunit